jgi:hypothetical protein
MAGGGCRRGRGAVAGGLEEVRNLDRQARQVVAAGQLAVLADDFQILFRAIHGDVPLLVINLPDHLHAVGEVLATFRVRAPGAVAIAEKISCAN